MSPSYNPPGVTVTETISSSVAPLIATPDDICLIGLTEEIETITMRPKNFSDIDFIDLGVPDFTTITNFSVSKVLAKNPLTAGTSYVSTSGYTVPTTVTPSTTHSYYYTDGDFTIFVDYKGILSSNKSVYLQRNLASVGTIASDITATQSSADASNAGDIYITYNEAYDIGSTTSGSIQLGDPADDKLEIIHYTSATNTKQIQTVTGPSTGNFTISFTGSTDSTLSPAQTTASISSTATAEDVLEKLADLAGIANTTGTTGNKVSTDIEVTRSGDAAPFKYTIKFKRTSTTYGSKVMNDLTATGTSVTAVIGGPQATSSVAKGSRYKLTSYQRAQGNTTAYGHSANATFKQASKLGVTGGVGVPDGTSVGISWKYTPADHWNAKSYTSVSDIKAKFGESFSADEKSVNSPISLAAEIAMNNGAKTIWIQPLFKPTGINDSTPKQPATAAEGNWTATLTKLQTIENLGVIVPIVGQDASLNNANMSGIFASCRKFIEAQRNANQTYVILIAGEDGTYSSTSATSEVLQNHAQLLDGDQQAVLVSPSIFQTITPTKNNKINIGGQYAAAAVAGRMVSLSASKSLTRRAITGFTGIPDPKSKDEKNLDAQSGLLVIEDNGVNIQVRHAITAAGGDAAPGASQSELSVVRAKQKMVSSLLNTIDTQIVGQIVADSSAELVIESSVRGVLQTLVDDKEIVGFNNVVATTKSYNPTIIDIAFNYRPAFPVNYVNINFSVDVTNGSLLNTTNNTAGVTNG